MINQYGVAAATTRECIQNLILCHYVPTLISIQTRESLALGMLLTVLLHNIAIGTPAAQMSKDLFRVVAMFLM